MTPDTSTREFVAVPREAMEGYEFKSICREPTAEMRAAGQDATDLPIMATEIDTLFRVMWDAAPLSTVPAAPVSNLRADLTEARELLLETRHGNPARSAGHNARLVIERALASLDTAAPVTGEDARIWALAKWAYHWARIPFTELPYWIDTTDAAKDEWYSSAKHFFEATFAPTPAPPRIDDAAVERATRVREETECKLLMERGHRPGDYGIASYDEYKDENKEFLRKCMRAALHAAFPPKER